MSHDIDYKTILVLCLIFSISGLIFVLTVQKSALKEYVEVEEFLRVVNDELELPDIKNFQEKKLVKRIFELRDSEVHTHTYIVNQMKGCLVYIGNSIGYGFPYAVQYTNPEKPFVQHHERVQVSLPQAEPNGLYVPDSSSATWVMLYDKDSKEANPIYIESEIVVSPFKIKHIECK